MHDKFYFDLYESLYQRGYHSDLNFTHSASAVEYLSTLYDSTDNVKVLDVGCSNGKAMTLLQEKGFDAHGIDVSKTAIDYCNQRGFSNVKLNSITNIEYTDEYFDSVICTDVLEHVHPIDVIKAVQELCRVAKTHIVVKIALAAEKNRKYQHIADEHLPNHNKNLHLTVWDKKMWTLVFKDFGQCNLEHVLAHKQNTFCELHFSKKRI